MREVVYEACIKEILSAGLIDSQQMSTVVTVVHASSLHSMRLMLNCQPSIAGKEYNHKYVHQECTEGQALTMTCVCQRTRS